MKCDRCGEYFDSNELKIKGGNSSMGKTLRYEID
ncbi:HTH DNA binding protein [Blautia phage Montmirail]|nr:HTH DNA binding protein [Blautia phage Montmirail]